MPINDSLFVFTKIDKPPSIGDICSFISCPYRGRAASNLKVSLQPRPAGHISSPPTFRTSFQIISTYLFLQYISNPSSPVYPVLETKQGQPHTFVDGIDL